MKYDFDQEIAKAVGVEEAILFANISWWCAKNSADRSRSHFRDGFYWTYSSERAWSELFPFWTSKQISRMTDNLEKAGLILVAQFGGSNRSKWFRPIEETERPEPQNPISPNGSMEQPERANPLAQTGQCINKESDSKPQIETTDIETRGVSIIQKGSFELSGLVGLEMANTKDCPEIDLYAQMEADMRYFEAGHAKLGRAIRDFVEMRNGMKKRFKTPLGWKGFLKNLAEYSGNDPEKAVAVIRQSIGNEWQGIFPLKDSSAGSKAQKGTNIPVFD